MLPIAVLLQLSGQAKGNRRGTNGISIFGRVPQQENSPAGCSKRPFSEAAGESKPEAYQSHPPNPELSEQLFSRVGYVEGLNDATCLREALRRRQGTMPGERRVSARQGWAGENGDFFSILLGIGYDCDHRLRHGQSP
jgi:hypothetical protein